VLFAGFGGEGLARVDLNRLHYAITRAPRSRIQTL
jgi:hypothetical protein